jgi:hypothetical protein
MRQPAGEWRRLGWAALLGAIVAFPAGMLFSARKPVQPQAAETSQPSSHVRNRMEWRDPYSPDVLGDPHVVDQHRRTVEAMELSCRQTGKLCAEAEQARAYLLAHDGSGKR